MAFLVCYSENPPYDHVANKAAYLDQSFYELVFSHCRDRGSEFATLGRIASLRYKSPVLVVSHEQLQTLVAELHQLTSSGLFDPQVPELCAVCATAQSNGCSLSISADMYPELGQVENEANKLSP